VVEQMTRVSADAEVTREAKATLGRIERKARR
jgi:hypothetical protein